MTAGSLRLRLFLAGVVAVLVALGLLAFGLTLLFERHVERRMAADLALVLDDLVSRQDRDAEGRLAISEEPGDLRFDRPLSGLYWQVTREPSGLVARSRSLWYSVLPLPSDELSEGALHQHRIAGPETRPLAVERRVVLPARLGGGAVRVVVARDTADLVEAKRNFTTDLAPFFVLIALLFIGAFGAQVAVGLAPARAVRARLAAIRSGAAEPYRLTPKGVQVALLFLFFHKRLCGPLANSRFHHEPDPKHRPQSQLETAYHRADKAIQQIV